MSEYQYYEFRAVDRQLSATDQRELRKLSTRARITATSFTNHYEWGDFSGDPAKLMQRWFDLHLYMANWGTRRLMIRLPKRLVRRKIFDRVLRTEGIELEAAGDNLILDIWREETEPDDYWDNEGDDSAWLAALAPLRADLLGGDLRPVYLLWLMAVETDAVDSSEPEPLPGIGPMTDALEAFVDFFQIDPPLAEAAAERPFTTVKADPDAARRIVSAFSDREKTEWLTRLVSDDPHTAVEIRSLIRERMEADSLADQAASPRRTAGEIRARAEAIREARRRKAAQEEKARLRKAAAEEERARRKRVDALRERGAAVWQQVETEINRRNPGGYKTAHSLLHDLKMLAELDHTPADFADRVRSIRERHARKGQFIERLKDLG